MKENLPRKTKHEPTTSRVTINLFRSHPFLHAVLFLPCLSAWTASATGTSATRFTWETPFLQSPPNSVKSSLTLQLCTNLCQNRPIFLCYCSPFLLKEKTSIHLGPELSCKPASIHIATHPNHKAREKRGSSTEQQHRTNVHEGIAEPKRPHEDSI